MSWRHAVSVLHLKAEIRSLVADTCLRRAELELKGAAAFHLVTGSLLELRADSKLLDLSVRSISEELRHAEIYRVLAERFRGEPVVLSRPAPIEFPSYDAVPARFAHALHVVGMSAIIETMACGFLQLCLDNATEPEVRTAIREILGDEIRHGQIGWAFLASGALDRVERAALSSWIPRLLETQVSSWLAQIATLPDISAPEYGCPDREAIVGATFDAIDQLVLPGFDHAKIVTGPARDWFAQRARR